MAQKNKKSTQSKAQASQKGFPVVGVVIAAVVVVVAAIGIYASGAPKSTPGTDVAGTQMQSTGSQASDQNSSGQSQTSGVQNVAAADAKKLIDRGVQLVDVRTKDEYDFGHLKDAKLVSVDEIDKHLSELSKDKPVLLYCASGARSAQAASYLSSNGFTKVYNLDGGISQWPYEIVK